MPMQAAVLLPKHRLGHPEKYIFVLSNNIFSGSKYPKNILFYFENGSTGCKVHDGTQRMISPRRHDNGTIDSFLAEVSVTSPRNLFIFIILKSIFWIKVSEKNTQFHFESRSTERDSQISSTARDSDVFATCYPLMVGVEKIKGFGEQLVQRSLAGCGAFWPSDLDCLVQSSSLNARIDYLQCFISPLFSKLVHFLSNGSNIYGKRTMLPGCLSPILETKLPRKYLLAHQYASFLTSHFPP